MDNIIKFPIENNNRLNIQEINEKVEFAKFFHINETSDLILENILENFSLLDISINENSYKDCAFLIETIKSLLYRKYNISHDFHEYIDKVMDEDTEGFIINKNIKISKKRLKKRKH